MGIFRFVFSLKESILKGETECLLSFAFIFLRRKQKPLDPSLHPWSAFCGDCVAPSTYRTSSLVDKPVCFCCKVLSVLETRISGAGGGEKQLQADRLHRRQGGERADATNEAASIGYNSIMRKERQLTIEISESNDAAWLCVAKSRTLPEVSAGIAPAHE